MAYNEALAERIRKKLAGLPKLEEKPMMGGLTFMVNGKMCVGIIKEELMCRIDPGYHETAIAKTGCRTMDFTKRPMIGYVMVNESGMKKAKDFDFWIELALEFNKKAKPAKKSRKAKKFANQVDA